NAVGTEGGGGIPRGVSGWFARRGGARGERRVNELRLVPGLDPLGPAEGERRSRAVGLAVDRLEQVPAVVAERLALEHASGEPILQPGQDGRSVRSRAPFAAGELVDLVAGLAAEEQGQLL